jgi:hypothetical protein
VCEKTYLKTTKFQATYAPLQDSQYVLGQFERRNVGQRGLAANTPALTKKNIKSISERTNSDEGTTAHRSFQ